MIDAKEQGEEYLKNLVALIHRYPELQSKIIICSGHKEFLRKLRERQPNWRIGWTLNSTARSLLKPAMTKKDLQDAKELGVESVQPLFSRISEKMINWCQASGMKVRVWGVSGPMQMRNLISKGVDGIITDYPDTLNKILVKMREKRSPKKPERRLPEAVKNAFPILTQKRTGPAR